jgi:integrase
VLLVSTGLRRGEARAVRWADVDLDEAVLRVRGTLARRDDELVVTDTKTRTSRRTIPLSAPSLATLRSLKQRHSEERLGAGNTGGRERLRLHDRARRAVPTRVTRCVR